MTLQFKIKGSSCPAGAASNACRAAHEVPAKLDGSLDVSQGPGFIQGPNFTGLPILFCGFLWFLTILPNDPCHVK